MQARVRSIFYVKLQTGPLHCMGKVCIFIEHNTHIYTCTQLVMLHSVRKGRNWTEEEKIFRTTWLLFEQYLTSRATDVQFISAVVLRSWHFFFIFFFSFHQIKIQYLSFLSHNLMAFIFFSWSLTFKIHLKLIHFMEIAIYFAACNNTGIFAWCRTFFFAFHRFTEKCHVGGHQRVSIKFSNVFHHNRIRFSICGGQK